MEYRILGPLEVAEQDRGGAVWATNRLADGCGQED